MYEVPRHVFGEKNIAPCSLILPSVKAFSSTNVVRRKYQALSNHQHITNIFGLGRQSIVKEAMHWMLYLLHFFPSCYNPGASQKVTPDTGAPKEGKDYNEDWSALIKMRAFFWRACKLREVSFYCSGGYFRRDSSNLAAFLSASLAPSWRRAQRIFHRRSKGQGKKERLR